MSIQEYLFDPSKRQGISDTQQKISQVLHPYVNIILYSDMSVYIQIGRMQEIQNILLAEGFEETQSQHSALKKFEVQLNQIQQSRLKQRYQTFSKLVIFKLLKEYLSSIQFSGNIWTIDSRYFDQAKLKLFVKFLKDINSNLTHNFHLRQLLSSEYVYSLGMIQRLAYISQSKELLEHLQALKEKQKILVNVSNKRIAVDTKKLQIFDVLVYNSQLRYNSFQKPISKEIKKIKKTSNKSLQDLRQELAQFKEKQTLMRKIIENGGWGLLTKIKQKISQLSK